MSTGIFPNRQWWSALAVVALAAGIPFGCTQDDDDSAAGDAGPPRCLTTSDCPDGLFCYLTYCVDQLPDASVVDPDAGPQPDAAVADGGSSDAAATGDAGGGHDGGNAPDAAAGTDAGIPGDAGLPMDSGHPGDGGGPPVDAGHLDASAPDAARRDAGPCGGCTGFQTCNVDSGVCESANICLSDQDCLSPLVCLFASCQEKPGCRADSDCDGGRCDTTTHACLAAECVSDQDCPSNGACQDYHCYTCQRRVTGDAGQLVLESCNGSQLCHCSGAGCQPAADICYPVECVTDQNCAGGKVCVQSFCAACRPTAGGTEGPSAQCAGNQLCRDNQCVEPSGGCTTNADCTGIRVCTAAHVCADPDCQALSQCPGGTFCDPFEPNNDLAGAAAVGPGEYQGTMCQGDMEFFRFDVPLGDGILLRVTPLDPKYGTVEAQMVDGTGAWLGSSTFDAFGATATYETAAVTPVYVRMQSITSPLVPFKLSVEYIPHGLCRADEAEPNDAPEMAYPLAAGTQGAGEPYEVNICTGDQDWYQADLRSTQAQALQLTMITERGANPALEIFEGDTSHQVVLDTSLDPAPRSFTLPRGGGLFLVHLYNQEPMVMSSGWLQVGMCEPDRQEPNDDVAHATPVTWASMDFTYSLCLADQDLFVADIPQSDLQWLRISTQAMGSAAPTVEVFKNDLNHLVTQDTTQGLERLVTVDDRGARFLVRLSNADPSKVASGSVRLDLCKPDIREPNNDAAHAAPVSLDGTEIALSVCRNDDDWLVATVPLPEPPDAGLEDAGVTVPGAVLTLHRAAGAHPVVELLAANGATVLARDTQQLDSREITLRNHTGAFLIHVFNEDRSQSGAVTLSLRALAQ